MKLYRLSPPSYGVRNHHAPRIRIRLGLQRFAFSLALALFAFLSTPAPSQAAKIFPADNCMSFLSSRAIQTTPENTHQSKTDAVKAAGHAATLGLLLGLGHATGPAEDVTDKARAPARSDVSALDIKRYRTCKKQQALSLSAL